MTVVTQPDNVIRMNGVWRNEANDVKIVHMGPDGAGKDWVMFYRKSNYPGWRSGEDVPIEEVNGTHPYKIREVPDGVPAVNAVPDDCIMCL